jgi:hypothetical protein
LEQFDLAVGTTMLGTAVPALAVYLHARTYDYAGYMMHTTQCAGAQILND